jgi:predicted dehydrogenase
MTVKRLKAVIIGSGLIAKLKHIPAFRKHRQKVHLAAICDVDLQAARQASAAGGIPSAYADVGEMLAKEKPDLVDICTPPKTHAKIAIQAIQAGSHVLIEKPMAQNLEECDTIIAAARENNVKVCVAHSDLFYYPFIEARKLVRDGVLGTFRGMQILLSTPTDYITSKSDHWANKLPGGVFGESGPHIIYMTLAFINPVHKVSVNAMKLMDYPWSPFEDYRIDLIGENAASSVIMNYATKQWMARVEILGDNATLMVDLEAMSLVKYRREVLRPAQIGMSILSESGQLLKNLAVNGFRYASGSLRSTHDFIIDGFADSIINGTDSPVPAEEGRESVRIQNMIVEQLNRPLGSSMSQVAAVNSLSFGSTVTRFTPPAVP